MPAVNHANYLLQPVNCRDLGNAYLQVLNHLEQTSGKNYNFSGRDEVLLIDLFRIIADELGASRKYLSVPFPICLCRHVVYLFVEPDQGRYAGKGTAAV